MIDNSYDYILVAMLAGGLIVGIVVVIFLIYIFSAYQFVAYRIQDFANRFAVFRL
jgi:hypothetical protein